MARGKNRQQRARAKRPAQQQQAVARAQQPPARQQPQVAPEVQQRLELVEQWEESYSGPIPHPAMLREYEMLLPGSADRIITMAETQSAHRQAMEKKVVHGNSWRATAGQFMGLVVALAFGYGSFELISDGHTVEGTILGTADLGGLVGIFVLGRRGQERERQRKREATGR